MELYVREEAPAMKGNSMKITYTGRQVELAPAQLKKLEARFVKIGKLLDGGKREGEAHVILSLVRHRHHAEVAVNYDHHLLVGLEGAGDLLDDTDLAADE